MEFDQEFVEYVAKAIVNKPEDVWAERKVDENGVLITLHVNPEDMGHVIGGAGKTAIAIRTLHRPIAAKSNTRIGFRIHDPSGRGFGEKKEGGFGGDSVDNAAAPAAPAAFTAPRVERDERPMDTTSVGDLTF